MAKLTSALIFIAYTFLFAFIAFLGNSFLRIQFVPGTMSKANVIADVPFEYFSNIKTEKLREQKKSQTSNVFTVDEGSYDRFIIAIKLLDEQIENFAEDNTLYEGGRERIREFVSEFMSLNLMKIEWQDVVLLISSLSPIERARAFQECISVLREIAKDGVMAESIFFNVEHNQAINYLGLKLQSSNKRNVRTLEKAMQYARMHLMSMDIDNEVVSILFNIVKQGIHPNLVYDAEESKNKFDAALKSVKPVLVKIKKGEVILHSGIEIDPETYEALSAYQKAVKTANRIGYGLHKEFYPKLFMSSISLYVIAFLMGLAKPSRRLNWRTISQCSILVIVQLLALRALIYIGEYDIFERQFLIIRAMPFAMPVLCASGIATLMYGVSEGVVVSALVSTYYTLMTSRSMEFLIVVLASNLVFLRLLKNANFRIKIVRAGVMSGITMTLLVLARDAFSMAIPRLTLLNGLAVMIMCASSGLLVVILLPFFERLFSTYSNVSLLELTDYNHPILKNLQVAAPGTYNHSLMVSNIAEQVAIQVGANSILCKTGAIYHDIGKISKAEYFIENQNNQINLHDKQTPYISTLVIKNHVRDGVELAREHRLPPKIIDIIQQHHGTTLIRYFYEKAKREFLESVDTVRMSDDEINMLLLHKIDTPSFRYDGPRPTNMENLIIMMADSIEAASRAMKRVTYQTIENLINEIFDMKLGDHQLDECPVTFNEISDLRKVFVSVLLSMMHSRISYNLSGKASDDPTGKEA
ncbi:MAG: HDIG domain-containing protein [Puniceicoccales bacterium]|nr:HDIG domain-containing protein [Puniceicoccales bacterium]